jgi:beta-glucosidase
MTPPNLHTDSSPLDERTFAYYDPALRRWVVEPGEFEILVGSSSRDIRARATMQGEPVDVY